MDITHIISSLGFPIAVCAYLFWLIQRNYDRTRAEKNQIHEQYRKEIEKILENAKEERERIFDMFDKRERYIQDKVLDSLNKITALQHDIAKTLDRLSEQNKNK